MRQHQACDAKDEHTSQSLAPTKRDPSCSSQISGRRSSPGTKIANTSSTGFVTRRAAFQRSVLPSYQWGHIAQADVVAPVVILVLSPPTHSTWSEGTYRMARFHHRYVLWARAGSIRQASACTSHPSPFPQRPRAAMGRLHHHELACRGKV
jgi:hypothetical protein